MCDTFTTIPTTHTVDSTLAAGLYVGIKLAERGVLFVSFTAATAVANDFVQHYYNDPDWISLGHAWDALTTEHGKPGTDKFHGYVTGLLHA